MKYLCRSLLALSVLVFFCATSLQAAPMGYTDQASFLAALSSPTRVLDFDSMTYGDSIADGDTVEGITFNYDLGGVQLMVTDDFGGSYPTTSSPNLLGTDDGDMFQDGDNFELAFAPSFAIGMYFITADEMVDDDITLTAGGVSVGLDVGAAEFLGTDDFLNEWYAYFLGIVDDTNAFNMASIVADGGPGGPYFLYNVDDITTTAPVPEPGTLLLIGTGLLGLTYTRRRRR